tara:strand:- start:112 stop:495 length:384 start_codon:yes stop_codon:yes gene_type:complete
MNLDTITNILLKTSMLEPFYLVSKDYNMAFKQAVSIIMKEAQPITVFLKNKIITIKLVYKLRWGVCIKTKKAFRFFSRKDIQKNNLWVEGPLIINIKDKICIQYMLGSYIYTKNIETPDKFKKIFFS